jgi:DNA-binding response OmpR family regulator
MKVLVIDGDNFAQNIYLSELHQENIAVEVANDGEEGLKKARETDPKIIILELILTKLNGFEVLKELKQDKKTKDIPVIVCSSLSQENDIKEAMDLGAIKYFSKEDYSLKQVTREVIEMLMTMM